MFEIGPSLREARLHKGVEIPDAERATKIRAKYLRALETESFDVLPGQAYIKSFLRSYADFLGLDGELYVDENNSRFVGGEDETTPMRARRVPAARRRKRERREAGAVLVALAAIAVVTALVIAAWKVGGPEDSTVPGLDRTTGATTTAAKKYVSALPASTRIIQLHSASPNAFTVSPMFASCGSRK